MLYLKSRLYVNKIKKSIDLTLTSVVFEILLIAVHFVRIGYLTLTSVVFEIRDFFCVGWISLNLTLTSVVFEIPEVVYIDFDFNYLTLTSVVFEIIKKAV